MHDTRWENLWQSMCYWNNLAKKSLHARYFATRKTLLADDFDLKVANNCFFIEREINYFKINHIVFFKGLFKWIAHIRIHKFRVHCVQNNTFVVTSFHSYVWHWQQENFDEIFKSLLTSFVKPKEVKTKTNKAAGVE